MLPPTAVWILEARRYYQNGFLAPTGIGVNSILLRYAPAPMLRHIATVADASAG